MAKTTVNTGTSGQPEEPEKQGELTNMAKPTQEPPTSPQAGPATNGSGDSQAGPGEPTRKPRNTQPWELKQLVQSEENLKRIAESLPRHMTPERWISVLLTVNSGSPKLQQCDARSILRAALQAAVLGLDLNTTMREAYLIPRSYEKAGPDGKPLRDSTGHIITFYEATFMPGYAGLRKLVMNGGNVLNVRSALVYEGELVGSNGLFVYQFSPDLEFIHKPCVNARERGRVVLAYAVAKLKTGEHVIEVMTIDEIERSGHQRSSMYKSRRPGAAETGPWVDDYEMMVRKTVLKRLCGQLPMSPEAQAAVDFDNSAYVSSVTTEPAGGGRRAIEQARRGRGTQTLVERLGEIDAAEADGDGTALDAVAPAGDTGAEILAQG